MVNSTIAEPDGCHAKKELGHRLYVALMASAAFIILVLCLTNRRNKYCKNILWRIPSIVIPVDLMAIGSSGYRLVYCVIMGCWGADLMHNVLDRSLYYSSQYSLIDAGYFFIFSPTVIILTQAWLYFPVFACVDASIPILTHTLGLLYTALLVSNNVHTDYTVTQGCSYRGEMSHREVGITVGSRVWTYILYLLLLLLFFVYSAFDTVQVLILGQRLTQKSHDDRVVCEKYVKRLLKRRGSTSQRNLKNYLIRGLHYVIPNAYAFYIRYPLPLLGAFFMGFAMLTHLTIFWSGHEFIWAEDLLHWLQGFQITVTTIETVLPSTRPYLDRLFHQVLSFAKAYEIILPLGSVVAFGLCSMFAFYMMQNTHKHFVEAARGNTSFMIRSELVPSLVYRLAATMRFTAFLVAHIVCSWMIYSLVLWILLSIGLGFYYAFNDFRHFAVHFWSWFMVPMMWGAAVYNLQLWLCNYVFLERRRGTLPLIRLQWLYHILTYFFFFFNAIFGFVMCVLRVFAVGVFTVVMLFRLDWDVYMRGLEGWDTGHRTYMSYMYMEYSYNNMIMRLFSLLLLESLHKTRIPRHRAQQRTRAPTTAPLRLLEGEEPEIRDSTAANGRCDKPYGRGRACLRWHLAFTLLRNPSLCHDRVHSNPHREPPTAGYDAAGTIN